jgi:hypothetical protein
MAKHSRSAMAPRLPQEGPRLTGGRRECRGSVAPAASCERLAHEHNSPQVHRFHPGIPCAMVYGLFRALLGVPGLIAPVTGRSSRPAWPQRRGAGTTRLCRPLTRAFALRAGFTSIASASTFVTMAIRRSLRAERDDYKHGFRNIFLSQSYEFGKSARRANQSIHTSQPSDATDRMKHPLEIGLVCPHQ